MANIIAGGTGRRLPLGWRRQHPDGSQLAAWPIKVVAFEDVAEQVGAQVFVRHRGEIEQRPFDRSAREPDQGQSVAGLSPAGARAVMAFLHGDGLPA